MTNQITNIRQRSTDSIIQQLYWDPYYDTVAWEYMVDAVKTALAESKANTIAGLSKYIKANLI